jgi:hypothetical protein
VKLVPVKVAGITANEVLIAGGVSPGQTVVTAGVNLLKPGQKVKILGEEQLAQSGAAKRKVVLTSRAGHSNISR